MGQTAAYLAVGAPVLWPARPELGGPRERSIIRWDRKHRESPWQRSELLVLYRPSEGHSVHLLWLPEWVFRGWYLNLEETLAWDTDRLRRPHPARRSGRRRPRGLPRDPGAAACRWWCVTATSPFGVERARTLSGVALIGRAALIVERPGLEAADPQNDPLFAARSALRRAVTMRESAKTQVQQLRSPVHRLEAERRAAT